MPTIASPGTWNSPITAAEVARSGTWVRWPGFVGDELWWAEMRPSEGGRMALVRRLADGRIEDVLPADWDIRNRVHEYGGRSWLAVPGAGGYSVVCTRWDDQRVYRFDTARPADTVEPIGPATGHRYADFAVAGTEVWCVRETPRGSRPSDVDRALVALPLDGAAAADPAAVRVLAESHRFLTGPRLSPNGSAVVWIGWDPPSMPWDSTELMVAEVHANGSLGPARVLAGGGESIVQAEWADDETLYVVSDRDGWWNIHRMLADGSSRVNLCPRAEEFGGALWQLGSRWFAVLGDGRLAVLHGAGDQRLGVLDPLTGAVRDLESGYTDWNASIAVSASRVAGVAAGPECARELAVVDLADREVRPARPPTTVADPRYLARGEARLFAGDVPVRLYPPRNADFAAPPGERPPYVVFAHGGPTSRSALALDLEIAFFTSRGIGIADVQYGGSTGFGREYRRRLRHHWGVRDVRDCAEVAGELVRAGLAAPGKLAIRGHSAGGFTAAAALCHDTPFQCAALYFPILDLAGWRTGETHDFEARYCDELVGPWPLARRQYEERSPVHLAGRITAPFVLFQGQEDVICPPVQAERFLTAVRRGTVPHAYFLFPGEPHGFRTKNAIEIALSAELALYGRVFGFRPPGGTALDLSGTRR